ncbi:MAG TPA: ATP-binding protein [Burkholderiaceae bacterium]|nr:ATP-binding protein [Burkholderiaceae bacterium]
MRSPPSAETATPRARPHWSGAWPVVGLVLAIVLVIFVGDLIFQMLAELWLPRPLARETQILLNDVVLSAICAVLLVPLVRMWQRRAAKSTRQLHETFELAPVGMTRIAPDGRFLQVNEAFADMVGRPREAVFALRWQDITSPEDVAADERHIEGLLRGAGIRYSAEKRYLHVDGSPVWVLQAVALVRNAAGDADYLIAAATDIGLCKRAEAALGAAEVAMRANAAKNEFLSRMSHELRTPLNAVIGFAQLLLRDARHPLAPQHASHIQRIERAGAHLLALINDVLDLSRIEARTLSLSPEDVDVRAVAEEALSIVAAHAAAVGVCARIDEAARATAAVVRADRVRLRQVLINLLSNAIKYNRTGGAARLGWVWRGGQWVIHVADTGHGMTADQLAHLFEPFNRLGAERGDIEGTGIGLVLSRHLVELMGGKLRAESEAGRGTVVTLTLPASQKGAAKPRPAEPSRPTGGPILKVLYVEDNELNVELVRAIVQMRSDVSLQVARSGAEALAMVKTDPPDLMLVDMHLGDTTGLVLGEALRAEPRTSAIRLVALSAGALPDQIDAALSGGFEAYLTKPLDVDALLRLLDEMKR